MFAWVMDSHHRVRSWSGLVLSVEEVVEGVLEVREEKPERKKRVSLAETRSV